MNKSLTHLSVLYEESLNALNIDPDGIYIDATFGRGGHSRGILNKLSSKGQLIAIDRDKAAETFALTTFSHDQPNMNCFSFVRANMSDIHNIVQSKNLIGKINGIFMDIGVSSPQLDEAERGFSFMRDGPLDMRMNNETGISARDWIKKVSLDDMTTVFKIYGEERFARKIATAIVEARTNQHIDTTKKLADIIDKASPFKDRHKHPATRCFQAIRIAINDELNELESTLKQLPDLLIKEGRVAIISFHSLEDRIVKQFLKSASTIHDPLPELPILLPSVSPKLKLIGKAIKASNTECNNNPRARSAILRVAEKL